MNSESLCKVEGSSSDTFSKLPYTVLENILCLLPIKEAVTTSIFSKEWRYRWTGIPKLNFTLSQVSKRITEGNHVQGNNMEAVCKPFDDLYQILLLHKGPILEFALHIDLKEADHKDPNGLDKIILHLSKNHTIKKLTLSGCDDSTWYHLPISIFMLHHLTDLDIYGFGLDHQPTSIGFGSLKSLSLRYVQISTKSLVHLLSSCPSLTSVTLICWVNRGEEECSIVWEEYSNVRLKHLNELVIGSLNSTKPEKEFVKFILSKSPKLEKVTTNGYFDFDDRECWEALKRLLRIPRVSAVRITESNDVELYFKTLV